MATIKITDKQLKDTLSLQLVNCNSFVNTLYKYMPASRLLDILEKDPHQIGFVSPEKWYCVIRPIPVHFPGAIQSPNEA